MAEIFDTANAIRAKGQKLQASQGTQLLDALDSVVLEVELTDIGEDIQVLNARNPLPVKP